MAARPSEVCLSLWKRSTGSHSPWVMWWRGQNFFPLIVIAAASFTVVTSAIGTALVHPESVYTVVVETLSTGFNAVLYQKVVVVHYSLIYKSANCQGSRTTIDDFHPAQTLRFLNFCNVCNGFTYDIHPFSAFFKCCRAHTARSKARKRALRSHKEGRCLSLKSFHNS